MKANELRIGNWVLMSGVPGDINAGFIADFDESTRRDNNFFDNVKPIPLTEEWLERFGFFEDNELGWVFDDDKGISISMSPELVWYYMGNIEQVWVDILTEIKYVHQLQNLYFALTGEELELN